MKILKTFATAEEAHVAASKLQSAGILAEVLEDRALGGNLLATTSRGARIQVADSEFEQAERILEAPAENL